MQDLIVTLAELIANVLIRRRCVWILNRVGHDFVEKIITLVTRQQISGQDEVDVRVDSLVILRRQKAVAVAEKTKHRPVLFLIVVEAGTMLQQLSIMNAPDLRTVNRGRRNQINPQAGKLAPDRHVQLVAQALVDTRRPLGRVFHKVK